MTAEEFLAEMAELVELSRELTEIQAMGRRARRRLNRKRADLLRAEVNLEGN